MNHDEVRSHWAGRTGEYSPEYYAYYGRDETSESVRRTVERYVDRDAAVLEVGCSCGRHLAHLQAAGFEDLTGIELNPEAFEVMAENYPDLAERGTFHRGAMEEFVGDFADDRFDVVYSVETLQHVHPDAEWVFADLARLAGELLVTVEVEAPVADRSEGGSDASTGGPPDDGGHDDRTVGPPAGDHGADEGPPGESGADTVTEPVGSGTDRDDGSHPETGSPKDRGEEGSHPETNYVHGEIPLYYRDWGAVFTGLGMTEVECRRHRRDTVRAFRPPSAPE